MLTQIENRLQRGRSFKRMMSIGVIMILVMCVGDSVVHSHDHLDVLSECKTDLDASVGSRELANCIFRAVSAQEEDGIELMERVSLQLGGDPWILFNLSFLRRRYSSREAAVADLERAFQLFESRRDLAGQAWSRWAQAEHFRLLGNHVDASTYIDNAMTYAKAADSASAMSVVAMEIGSQAVQSGANMQVAYRNLRFIEDESESSISDDDDKAQCSISCKETLANLSYQLGHLEEASSRYRRLWDHAVQVGDRFSPFARLMLAIVECEIDDRDSKSVERASDRALAAFQESLQIALDQGSTFIQARNHELLGRLLQEEDALPHLNACVETGTASGRTRSVADCLNGLAVANFEKNPARAFEYRNKALAISQEQNDPWFDAFLWFQAMKFDWMALSRGQAIERSIRTLDVMERLRALQHSNEGRATWFSTWTRPYRSLVGRLLSPDFGATSAGDTSLAFAVSEQLRARVLLDVMESVDASPAPLDEEDSLEIKRRTTLSRVVTLQRSMFESGLNAESRAERVRELEQLEAEAKRLNEQIAQAHPDYAALERSDFATLDDVQAALGPNEALLSLQMAHEQSIFGYFMGGSWLLAITRDAVEVIPLPDGRQLRPLVELHSSQLAERREDDLGLARTLHADLLADGLAGLPSAIERLIIVPDGPLHLLPFSSLVDAADAPLASRYQISVVPSASLWLRWRRAERAPQANAALILADPAMGTPVRRVEGEGLRAISVEPPLPPLPQAQREGRAVARYLGATSELLLGAAASERTIKEAALDDYGLVHFAAHAIVHQDEPDRSAIMLAPGGDDEDGLLQIREIVKLDLDGRVVVLSACSSAAGQVLRGEGVMSLARGFFQAGARAVVGSLWPLEDTEAAALFDTFYLRLTRGDSLDVALRHAQAERRDAGASEVDWAGVQVFGDGGFVPFPGGIQQPGTPWRVTLIVMFVVLALVAVASRRNTSATR